MMQLLILVDHMIRLEQITLMIKPVSNLAEPESRLNKPNLLTSGLSRDTPSSKTSSRMDGPRLLFSFTYPAVLSIVTWNALS